MPEYSDLNGEDSQLISDDRLTIYIYIYRQGHSRGRAQNLEIYRNILCTTPRGSWYWIDSAGERPHLNLSKAGYAVQPPT